MAISLLLRLGKNREVRLFLTKRRAGLGYCEDTGSGITQTQRYMGLGFLSDQSQRFLLATC